MRTTTLLLFCLTVLLGPAHAESLYSPESPFTGMFQTVPAKKVGDLLTIIIDERSTAQETSRTDTERESKINSSIDGKSSILPFGDSLPINPIFKFDSQNDYEGRGSTQQSNQVSARISAKVVRVQENGNLLLEGRRELNVGKDKRSILITGTVRPEDVKADNSVHSSAISDAEIHYEGQGVVNNTNRPGIFHRILDLIPFF